MIIIECFHCLEEAMAIELGFDSEKKVHTVTTACKKCGRNETVEITQAEAIRNFHDDYCSACGAHDSGWIEHDTSDYSEDGEHMQLVEHICTRCGLSQEERRSASVYDIELKKADYHYHNMEV